MKSFVISIAAAALLATAGPAHAQGTLLSNKIAFLNAIKERDALKANELARTGGSAILDVRGDDGSTPLTVTIAREDAEWTGFLISKGANVNLPGKGGDTPLILAARVGFHDAVRWLLSKKARVDQTNRSGETALIAAVHQRQLPIVRLLLDAGADPDKADTAAGLSARDYAKRDTRSRQILQAIEAKKPATTATNFRL
ncbi:ankyrin repeat domain-containing protein [Sphingomonas lutea]|uniref:ankyrin repeat domain-containing protein n=1 Tax=Sphingomonas lutea TaxID=1045317 RepID=UPI001F1997CD|nr:ankyrin repeat domain-containing protein [Sphingomonas lutea]